MTYDPDTNVFSAETEDDSLIDTTKPYGIEAEFTDYPTVTFPTVTSDTSDSTITFTGPCATDATI